MWQMYFKHEIVHAFECNVDLNASSCRHLWFCLRKEKAWIFILQHDLIAKSS